MVLIFILMVLVLLFAAALFAVYRMAFHSPDRKQNNIFNLPESKHYLPYRKTMIGLIQDLMNRPFEEVTITSHDGLKLYGRYYHCRDGAPLDIAFHGYRGTAERDMCGGIQLSYRSGHNVLLVDQRAHGKSQGRAITFGILERLDCRAWVNYARQRFGRDVRIMLYGVSMGASTVLMASELDLGGSVRGIIADCPYSSPAEIIRKVCMDMKFPPKLVFPLVVLSARIFAGFNLDQDTAESAVQRSDIPILILHGEEDRFVPPEMSEVIALARPDIRRLTFPGAAHGMSALACPEAYDAAVLNFIENCMK